MFNYRVCREYYSFLYSVFGAENWPFVATLIGAILVVGGYYGTFCLIRRFFWDFEMGLPSSIVPLVIFELRNSPNPHIYTKIGTDSERSLYL